MPRALEAHGDPNSEEHRTEELEDQLLELLRTHESLGQEEFLQALRRQRSSEEGAASLNLVRHNP